MVLSLENLSPRRFNTNSHGHISDVEYPVEKPSGEYRIVVIGDSFTAGVTNSVRWPDELERELRRHGLDRCRVINVGLDGISASQFIDVYKHEARRFEPDMVVVNILADNLPRPPYSRGAHNLETRPEAAREFARSHFVDPLPWWNPTPELVARKPFGQRLGFRPKLDPQLRKASLDEGQAFAASLQSLREIQRLHPRVLVLYHPTFEDWTGTLRPQLAELRERLFSEADDLRIVDMAAELPDLAAAGASLQRWYQIPTDGHPSDEGMRRYGAAAARPVLARIGNRP